MAIASTGEPNPRKPLRLWPGVILAALLVLLRYVVPVVLPQAADVVVLGGLAAGLLILLWWMFFSRAPWLERLGAIIAMVAAVAATSRIVDVSIATGAMGMLFYVLAFPLVCLALVVWAVACRRLGRGARFAALVGIVFLASGSLALARTGGFTGGFDNDLAWRWSKTPEERLLAESGDEPMAPAPAVPEAEPEVHEPEWPGFRGPDRDGVVHGVRIETDWSQTPPVELWRRPIGPAWSSFAVDGELFYTQEQRGDEEAVACYTVATAEPVWRHGDPARFWESNAGAGPRGTPTLSDGRVYAFGATGILNVLDARDGTVAWSRNAASDVDAKTPYWGFSSSPLVTGDVVIVGVSGELVAYDLATGAPRWTGPKGGESYSSPHLATIDGVEQVLLLSEAGVVSVAPVDGAQLWEHEWKGYPIVQPALTADGDVLISVTDSSGLRRLAPAHGPGGWTVEERWTSAGLKPYFNDFVVHEGHAYGFDGRILSCIDLETGERRWKGGRYGNGQLVVLADQDVLLVLSETGELALVAATPDRFTELASFPAIEGKTWNHPVLAGDVLLVRNAEEMVAFRLSSRT